MMHGGNLKLVQHTVQQLGVPGDINQLPSFMHVPALVAVSLLMFSCHEFVECSGAILSADLAFIPKTGLWTTVYWLFNCVNVWFWWPYIWNFLLRPRAMLFGSLPLESLYFLLVQRNAFVWHVVCKSIKSRLCSEGVMLFLKYFGEWASHLSYIHNIPCCSGKG